MSGTLAWDIGGGYSESLNDNDTFAETKTRQPGQRLVHVAAGQGAAGCKAVSRTGLTYSDPHRGEIIIPDWVYIVKTVYTWSGVWDFLA